MNLFPAYRSETGSTESVVRCGHFHCDSRSLRILTVSAHWQGANDYAFTRAFRRAGHSVQVVPSTDYFPAWNRKPLRALRRLLRPVLITEYNRAMVASAERFRPHLFFVFKGEFVTPDTISTLKNMGAVAVQFYPDVSFRTHGAYLPRALPMYDWVFTTKSFGLEDMANQLGVPDASFLPHAYDPETHVAVALSESDLQGFECDVSFIGNWSSKKQHLLQSVQESLPAIELKIWGPAPWLITERTLVACYQMSPITGLEYAKAIGASKINIAILSEKRHGASSGDRTTARTFEIPAAGGFMLHERTEEAMEYFEEGKECAFFSDPEDLVAKIRYYLAHEDERRAIALAGRQRCLTSGYSVDDRAATVIAKYHELRAARDGLRRADGVTATPTAAARG